MTVAYDAVRNMRHITLRVKVKRGAELRWRIWLGTRLLMLAARVMNCNVNIEAVAK